MPADTTDRDDTPDPTGVADALTTEQLLAAARVQTTVRAALKADATYGFDKPWEEFLALLRFANPQSYGKRFEKRAIAETGAASALGMDEPDETWEAVPASADRGDVRVLGAGEDPLDPAAGRWLEMKVSFLLFESDQVNCVQIRPHQELDGYVIYVVDPDNRLYRFDLTAAQMHAEVEATGGSLAHGTRGATADNTNKEYAVRFTFDDADEVCRRWKRRYLVGTSALADDEDEG